MFALGSTLVVSRSVEEKRSPELATSWCTTFITDLTNGHSARSAETEKMSRYGAKMRSLWQWPMMSLSLCRRSNSTVFGERNQQKIWGLTDCSRLHPHDTRFDVLDKINDCMVDEKYFGLRKVVVCFVWRSHPVP